MHFTCPCCGYDQLSVAPYRDLPGPPVPASAEPPYEDSLGPASYEVCSCCGFEFGFEDNPGASGRADSFESYRHDWLDRGAPWFSPAVRPAGWNADEQLAAAGLIPSRGDRIAVIVASALTELLERDERGADVLYGQESGPGTPGQRFGAGLDRLLGDILRAEIEREGLDEPDWLQMTDGLGFMRCRRTADLSVEVVAMWHVGRWDASANSPWLVPVHAHLYVDPKSASPLRLSASVGERDALTSSLVLYERESRAATHRSVTILDDLGSVDWYYRLAWP